MHCQEYFPAVGSLRVLKVPSYLYISVHFPFHMQVSETLEIKKRHNPSLAHLVTDCKASPIQSVLITGCILLHNQFRFAGRKCAGFCSSSLPAAANAREDSFSQCWAFYAGKWTFSEQDSVQVFLSVCLPCNTSSCSSRRWGTEVPSRWLDGPAPHLQQRAVQPQLLGKMGLHDSLLQSSTDADSRDGNVPCRNTACITLSCISTITGNQKTKQL